LLLSSKGDQGGRKSKRQSAAPRDDQLWTFGDGKGGIAIWTSPQTGGENWPTQTKGRSPWLQATGDLKRNFFVWKRGGAGRHEGFLKGEWEAQGRWGGESEHEPCQTKTQGCPKWPEDAGQSSAEGERDHYQKTRRRANELTKSVPLCAGVPQGTFHAREQGRENTADSVGKVLLVLLERKAIRDTSGDSKS